MAQIVLWGGGSHLHLPLGQIGSELLGCIEDLPLMPQQAHPEILDVSEGERRCCIQISIRQKTNRKQHRPLVRRQQATKFKQIFNID